MLCCSHEDEVVCISASLWRQVVCSLQILGAEAQARVPSEFIMQQPDSANPPTLFLVLAQMADKLAQASTETADSSAFQHQQEFLRAAFPHLAAWFRWFNTTQAGPVPGSYRWRGRDAQTDRELNPKTLTSGKYALHGPVLHRSWFGRAIVMRYTSAMFCGKVPC